MYEGIRLRTNWFNRLSCQVGRLVTRAVENDTSFGTASCSFSLNACQVSAGGQTQKSSSFMSSKSAFSRSRYRTTTQGCLRLRARRSLKGMSQSKGQNGNRGCTSSKRKKAARTILMRKRSWHPSRRNARPEPDWQILQRFGAAAAAVRGSGPDWQHLRFA